MNSTISVCIPTCNRPEHFEEALQSVLRQDLTVQEVLVGDDSTDKATKRVVDRYLEQEYPIRYFRNEPSLGQARNVDRLFREASGEYLVLLHDDDLLLENALSHLLESLKENPNTVAAFGKQQLADANGEVKWKATKGLNAGYYRTSDFEGVQPDPIRSAITQQFPNDGYMVRRKAATSVGYTHKDAGDACDFMFGVTLAQKTTGDFVYTDQYTSLYRQTETSVARGEDSGDMAYHAFRYVHSNFPELAEADPYVNEWMHSRAPVAVMTAAQHGYALEGMKWFFGRYHRHRIATLGGIRRFIYLVRSFVTS